MESIELSLADVELPPQVRLKLAELQNASLADLKIWLSFRGDSGKATDTAVKCRTKYVYVYLYMSFTYKLFYVHCLFEMVYKAIRNIIM